MIIWEVVEIVEVVRQGIRAPEQITIDQFRDLVDAAVYADMKNRQEGNKYKTYDLNPMAPWKG